LDWRGLTQELLQELLLRRDGGLSASWLWSTGRWRALRCLR
jgi:hypothetical protein